MKVLLSVVIMSFSAWSLLRHSRHELKDDRLAGFFGFFAGILGGAYGMNGPPLAIYGSLRKWTPANFRATLQGYFLPASLAGMAGYGATGLWTPAVSRFYLLSLPAVVVAVFLGRIINRRMHPVKFIYYVHAGLIVIGAVLLVQTL
jgi:uncharacterized membrane protein YfcA